MLVAPKNEIIWAVYVCDGVQTHAITSTALRDVYYLYKIRNDKFIKTKKKAQHPMDLEKYIDYLKG